MCVCVCDGRQSSPAGTVSEKRKEEKTATRREGGGAVKAR